jgi:hypothetical protein
VRAKSHVPESDDQPLGVGSQYSTNRVKTVQFFGHVNS